ncbi:MAG: adenine phosphoribosyltransferase [Ignavibacteriales bacterium]|nr:adenine phosphoribosyltransferase [Ignavibacteriales bacterium]
MELSTYIRTVPDFPKAGIMFRDITTMLKDRDAFAAAVEQLYAQHRDHKIDKVACVESRGFILGGALAARLGAGFIPIRKPGKLPAAIERQEYQLEYGTDVIEIHRDAIISGERILLHDDLLATGGTIDAACRLVERLGGTIVGLSFLIELAFLEPRKKLPGRNIFSLITYNSEDCES